MTDSVLLFGVVEVPVSGEVLLALLWGFGAGFLVCYLVGPWPRR